MSLLFFQNLKHSCAPIFTFTIKRLYQWHPIDEVIANNSNGHIILDSFGKDSNPYRNISNLDYLISESLYWQHISCKPTNLCKFGNYQSEPLDADPMDGVRGLKRKKGRWVGCLSAKKIPPLTPSIGAASSGPDW